MNNVINCYYLENKKRNIWFVSRFCENVNFFWSKYSDFNSMWRFIVTDVINEKKLQRFRCVAWRKHTNRFSKNLLIIHEKKQENDLFFRQTIKNFQIMILRSSACFSNSWRNAWSKWIARKCRCKLLFDSKISLQMRQLWHETKMSKKVRKIDERYTRSETTNILYNKMFHISETDEINKRRENVDVLYNKMIDFSNHLLKIMRFDFANVCCWKFFEFRVFEFWLIEKFWLIATNLK